MKIRSVEGFLVPPRWLFVKITTQSGLVGWGEPVVEGKAATVAACVSEMGKALNGHDAEDIEDAFQMLYRGGFYRGGPVLTSAISGIEQALWDIKGKALGVPVYELLGGKTNETIRAYASQLQFDWGDVHRNITKPEDYYEATKKAMAQGYTAVKVDPIGVTNAGIWARESNDPSWKMRGKMSAEMVATGYQRVAAMREAGGKDLDIIIELHSYTDAITAVQLGKALEPLNIYYYEEPVHPLNVENMLEVHKNVNIPIASGERIYTRWGFREFLEKGAIQVIQPDVCNTGGISESKKICDMANIYDASVQIHVCGGPISTAAALQIETVIPNFLIHEVHEGAIKKEVCELGKYSIQPVNGVYTVPDRPGIGQELSDKAMAEAVNVYTFK